MVDRCHYGCESRDVVRRARPKESLMESFRDTVARLLRSLMGLRASSILGLCLALSPLAMADVHAPGDDVALGLTIVDWSTGGAVTGESPTVAVWRVEDGYYLDWADSTFKASGWTTQYQSLTEIGTTGRYSREVATTSWDPGNYLALLTNAGDNAIDSSVAFTLKVEVQSGWGSVAVDEDYGGADALRAVDSAGSPIEDLSIRVYLTTDYEAGRLSQAYVKGSSITDVNGDWETPVYLDPAEYTVVFAKSGKKTTTTEITVEAE